MKIVSLARGIEASGTSIVLGMFDGVHMGHRRIILAAKNKGTERGIPTSVLLFSSSPHSAPALLPLCDRLSELEKLGVNYAYVYDFEELRDKTPEEFVRDELVEKHNAVAAFAGYNYRFGAKAAGDADMLKTLCNRYGVECDIAECVEHGGESVSASRIRKLLLSGNIAQANELLTYPYYIRATVQHGKELGRKLGLPTVNMQIDKNSAQMARGIYYTKTCIDGAEYISVSNLGVRPTVEDTDSINLETHIIGFDGDLYGKCIKVSFYGKGRGEKRFDSVDALRREVENDRKCAIEFFEKQEGE